MCFQREPQCKETGLSRQNGVAHGSYPLLVRRTTNDQNFDCICNQRHVCARVKTTKVQTYLLGASPRMSSPQFF